jgi:hypothetical protein
MTLQKIKDLLAEAAKPETPMIRLTQIQCELGHATAALNSDGVYEVDTPAAGIYAMVKAVFVATARLDRAMIPGLFPFFAVACGDREPDVLFQMTLTGVHTIEEKV